MRWNKSYVVKRMEGKDFSGLRDMSNDTVYLYTEPLDMEMRELIVSLRANLQGFDPERDILVLAGNSTVCALTLAMLMSWHRALDVATYRNGRYAPFRLADDLWEGLISKEYEEAV